MITSDSTLQQKIPAFVSQPVCHKGHYLSIDLWRTRNENVRNRVRTYV